MVDVMKINVRIANGDVHTFALADGWHVTRESGELVVRRNNSDRVHIFAPGEWRECWIE